MHSEGQKYGGQLYGERIIHSNPIIEQYFRAIPEEERFSQVEKLLLEGIERRQNMETSACWSAKRKGKKEVAGKVTETDWKPFSPVRIFGKPRIKPANDQSCVVHSLSNCSSAVTLPSRESITRAKESREDVQGSRISTRPLKIYQVVQIKHSPTFPLGTVSSQSQMKLPNGFDKDPYRKGFRREDEPEKGAMREKQKLNHFKYGRRIQKQSIQRQKLERMLLQQRQKLQRMEEKLKLRQSRQAQRQDIECSCCSDDSQVLQRLQEIYQAHSKHLHPPQRRRDKTYKISTAGHYPISSSQSSHHE